MLQVGEEYLALTRVGGLDRFGQLQREAPNGFFAEMLRHLPLAEPLRREVYGP